MTKPSAELTIRPGREKPILNRHPWLFSGAISAIKSGNPKAGDVVDLVASDGRWLARAYYNPHSQIRARILSWDSNEDIDDHFWESLLRRAVASRKALQLGPETTAYRLVNAESDGMPGLIVDAYDRYLVVQSLTMGIERRKGTILTLLETILEPDGILERSDAAVRREEGLPKVSGLLYGKPPPSELIIRENGLLFTVDLYRGHKTGFYLDQRENRALIGQPRFSAGGRILNVFAYTGAFSVYAAAAGAAEIANIEQSIHFLGQVSDNLKLNGLEQTRTENVAGDAFQVLRHFRDGGRHFDLIILDPPKFAHSKRDVPSACRGYKDLNWLSLQLLKPGGILATFSCSGRVDHDLFQKVLFSAAIDAGRDVQIIQKLGQSMDHPTLVTFPESAYLKGFLCRVY